MHNAPAASTNAEVSTQAKSNAGVGLIGGFIKIERQAAPVPPAVLGVWTDVTMEILNYGIGGPNLEGGALIGSGSGICADPTPNAIIRVQRLRFNASSAAGSCGYGTAPRPDRLLAERAVRHARRATCARWRPPRA